jgi:hypothetical protein
VNGFTPVLANCSIIDAAAARHRDQFGRAGDDLEVLLVSAP